MKNSRLDNLCNSIRESVKDCCSDNVSIAFSGGIDSTLIAYLAKDYCNTELIAVGTTNAYDLDAAESAANLIDMQIKKIVVTPEEMLLEALEMKKRINMSTIEIEFMTPFWIAAKNASNKILMCGQGADELFGGYARFRNRKLENNLRLEVENLLNRLPDREKKITDLFGLKLECPYLSKITVKTAELFSQKERIGNTGKAILREAALKMELPKEIAMRKKKAAQYGSGSQKAIKKTNKHRLELNVEFESDEVAKAVMVATEPENKGWIETNLEGKKLTATLRSHTIGSLKETAEDFMACVTVAKGISK